MPERMNRTHTTNPWSTPPQRVAPVGTMFRLILMPIVVLAAAALVAAGLFPIVGGAGKAAKLLAEQIHPSDKDLTIPQLALRSTIYAADGSVISQVADENRIPVLLSEVNPFAQDAILAVEDHDFYKHGPVDVKAIIRAVVANYQAGGIVQGGSTITQQLVKNFYTGNEQTLQRKIQEAKDAIVLERTL